MKEHTDPSRLETLLRVGLVCLLYLCSSAATAIPQNLPPTPNSVVGTGAGQPYPATNPTSQTAVETKPPVDPLGRTSPYGCVLGFLRAAEAKNYEKASQYLDGKRSQKQAEELVIQLKYLLDQGLSTSIDTLSRSPEGQIGDQLRVSRDRVGTIKTPNGDLNVMLDLVKRPGEPAVWLFSQETLNLVPGAYASVHHTDYESLFPAWTRSIRILSVPLWRWGVILLCIVIIFGIATLLTWSMLRLLKSIFKKNLSSEVTSSVLALKLPLFCLVVALMQRLAGAYAITALARHYWKTAGLVLVWTSAAWLLIRIADILINLVRHRLTERLQVEQATFVSLLGRLFKIFVGIILIIALLTHAGVNVSALVAGLGIGGIALALAAQKTLADLFGGFSIVMRGAVRVGDFCRIDGITGTVEDIGISALNLRTLDRSVVSIPNSKVAAVGLENFSLRDEFWLHQIFTLKFDTPPDVLRTVLDRINQLLISHPDINGHTARARLINLTPAGPQIEVYAYFRRAKADWAVFLSQQEELVLQILSVIAAAGSSLSTPIGILRMDSPQDEKNT